MMMCKSGIAYIFKFIVIFSCIIHSGFKDIIQSAESVWCTQHMETNDVSALKTFCLNTRNQQRIMADIYGSHTDVVLQEGLADALDEDDYDAKLKSLFGVWEDIAPGFWNWFDKNRSEIFKDCSRLKFSTKTWNIQEIHHKRFGSQTSPSKEGFEGRKHRKRSGCSFGNVERVGGDLF